MRPPPVSSSSSLSAYDTTVDWIEDELLRAITNVFPSDVMKNSSDVWSVSAERRSDYYAAKIFSPKQEYVSKLYDIKSDLEESFEGYGISVIVYPQLADAR